VTSTVPGVVLRFADAAPPDAAADRPAVLLDTTREVRIGPPGAEISVRDVAERVLSRRDLIAETADHLDTWAEASGVVDAMALDGTSFWYYFRLRHWMWLQQQILWLGIVDEIVRDAGPAALQLGPDTDETIVAAATLIAARDGLEAIVPDAPAAPAARRPSRSSSAPPAPARPGPPPASLLDRLDDKRLELLARRRPQPDEPEDRRAFVAERIDRLAERPGRLLVVLEHARQRVETRSGPRLTNPYLGPVVDRLRGTHLDPIEIDIRAKLSDDDTWHRLHRWSGRRLLPSDAVWVAGAPWDPDDFDKKARAVADRIAATDVPVVVSGVDLGPALADCVATEARRSLAGQFRGAHRVRRLLQRLRPAAVLLADEYHRQTWLSAARAEGIPTVAIQHGMIYRWHNGYIHRSRPETLRLPARTYVFGRWERDLLVRSSVYRGDEVRVGGSPRLDLVAPGRDDRDAIRAELGVAPGDRLVVISGTWGPIYRRFHYPIGLANLVDRPLPNVHFVVKLHPGEPDEGPYRAVIENAAARGGFAPPPVSVVQAVDLYRLLRAADAHVGIHSTVLTEAVATGTPNLLVDGLAGADLLGFVEAGVARPVRDGADLLAALDDGARTSDEARKAFLAAHFEPGNASKRIAADLKAWL
jgi:glycosyltransferase involved in cell wall biosynthesis